jgi:light-regulated signal transduction histidine kinase (bacteriophytochrome)
MGNSDQDRAAAEIERLRQALDAETEHCLDVQRQLERANAEFEDFVSTAVHNLREPLRGVASYSQLLSDACAGRLDADAIAFLAHIQEDAARMQSLLAGIVDYWAAGAGDRQPSRTDMEAVFGQADLAERKFWDQYTSAYEECLSATSTKAAPWHVVPADDKLNARLIVSRVVIEALQDLKMSYPKVTEAQRNELLAIRKQLAK